MSILIKGGRVVTSADDYFADVLIKGEKVVAIGADLDAQADRVIDATGKLVIPGADSVGSIEVCNRTPGISLSFSLR